MDSVEKSFSLFMAYVERLHFFSASFNGLNSVENIFSWFVVAHCAWETNPFFKVNWGCFFQLCAIFAGKWILVGVNFLYKTN